MQGWFSIWILINVIHHTGRIKGKYHVIISTDAENISDNFKHTFLRGMFPCWPAAKQDREGPALMAAMLPHFLGWDTYLQMCIVSGCWNSGFSGQIWGEGLVWLHRNSPYVLECGPGCNWECMQNGVWVCHRSPIINALMVGCGSDIEASLPACSQQGTALAMEEFGSTHAQGLKSKPIIGPPTVGHDFSGIWELVLCEQTHMEINTEVWVIISTPTPGHGFSRLWELVLCESAHAEGRMTTDLIISTPAVEAGPGVVPAAVDFLGAHNGWWMVSQCHTSWLTSPGEEHAVAPFTEGALQLHLPHPSP